VSASPVTRVRNFARKFGAQAAYMHVRVTCDGKPTDLLLTEREYSLAKTRAEKNPEDLPERSGGWLSRLFG